MTQGPACSTVTGCTSPLSSNSCVIPIFLPRIPVTAIMLSLLLECLDLDVHTCRKIEFHQGIDGLLGGLENIDQPLVRADLKSFTRFLIDVRRTQHTVLVFHRGQRNGARNLCAGALGGFDNLTGRGIEHPIVVCLKANANSLSYHL